MDINHDTTLMLILARPAVTPSKLCDATMTMLSLGSHYVLPFHGLLESHRVL